MTTNQKRFGCISTIQALCQDFYREVDPAHVRSLKTGLLHFRWEDCLGIIFATLLAGEERSLRKMSSTDVNKEVLVEGFLFGVVNGLDSRNVIRGMKAKISEGHYMHRLVHKTSRLSARTRRDVTSYLTAKSS